MVPINENLLKILRLIALLSGSVLSFFFAGTVIFGGAFFIEELTIDNPLQLDKDLVLEFFGLLSAILIILSVVIAWFKSKLGGLLITVSAMLHIISVSEPEILWMQISIIPVGIILLVSPSNSRSISKKEEI